MKQYIKNGEIKKRNEIVLHIKQDIKGEERTFQVINPTHDMLLSNGWIEYIKPVETDEELLQKEKLLKRKEILKYDSSKEVNQFYINGIPMWLDKATRTGLELRFKAEMAIGKTETTLWHGVNQFPLSLEMAFQLLYALEIYASACYDNTQRHLAEIEKLTTLEEVMEYDYKVGYPEKLNF